MPPNRDSERHCDSPFEADGLYKYPPKEDQRDSPTVLAQAHSSLSPERDAADRPLAQKVPMRSFCDLPGPQLHKLPSVSAVFNKPRERLNSGNVFASQYQAGERAGIFTSKLNNEVDVVHTGRVRAEAYYDGAHTVTEDLRNKAVIRGAPRGESSSSYDPPPPMPLSRRTQLLLRDRIQQPLLRETRQRVGTLLFNLPIRCRLHQLPRRGGAVPLSSTPGGWGPVHQFSLQQQRGRGLQAPAPVFL